MARHEDEEGFQPHPGDPWHPDWQDAEEPEAVADEVATADQDIESSRRRFGLFARRSKGDVVADHDDDSDQWPDAVPTGDLASDELDASFPDLELPDAAIDVEPVAGTDDLQRALADIGIGDPGAIADEIPSTIDDTESWTIPSDLAAEQVDEPATEDPVAQLGDAADVDAVDDDAEWQSFIEDTDVDGDAGVGVEEDVTADSDVAEVEVAEASDVALDETAAEPKGWRARRRKRKEAGQTTWDEAASWPETGEAEDSGWPTPEIEESPIAVPADDLGVQAPEGDADDAAWPDQAVDEGQSLIEGDWPGSEGTDDDAAETLAPEVADEIPSTIDDTESWTIPSDLAAEQVDEPATEDPVAQLADAADVDAVDDDAEWQSFIEDTDVDGDAGVGVEEDVTADSDVAEVEVAEASDVALDETAAEPKGWRARRRKRKEAGQTTWDEAASWPETGEAEDSGWPTPEIEESPIAVPADDLGVQAPEGDADDAAWPDQAVDEGQSLIEGDWPGSEGTDDDVAETLAPEVADEVAEPAVAGGWLARRRARNQEEAEFWEDAESWPALDDEPESADDSGDVADAGWAAAAGEEDAAEAVGGDFASDDGADIAVLDEADDAGWPVQADESAVGEDPGGLLGAAETVAAAAASLSGDEDDELASALAEVLAVVEPEASGDAAVVDEASDLDSALQVDDDQLDGGLDGALDEIEVAVPTLEGADDDLSSATDGAATDAVDVDIAGDDGLSSLVDQVVEAVEGTTIAADDVVEPAGDLLAEEPAVVEDVAVVVDEAVEGLAVEESVVVEDVAVVVDEAVEEVLVEEDAPALVDAESAAEDVAVVVDEPVGDLVGEAVEGLAVEESVVVEDVAVVVDEAVEEVLVEEDAPALVDAESAAEDVAVVVDEPVGDLVGEAVEGLAVEESVVVEDVPVVVDEAAEEVLVEEDAPALVDAESAAEDVAVVVDESVGDLVGEAVEGLAVEESVVVEDVPVVVDEAAAAGDDLVEDVPPVADGPELPLPFESLSDDEVGAEAAEYESDPGRLPRSWFAEIDEDVVKVPDHALPEVEIEPEAEAVVGSPGDAVDQIGELDADIAVDGSEEAVESDLAIEEVLAPEIVDEVETVEHVEVADEIDDIVATDAASIVDEEIVETGDEIADGVDPDLLIDEAIEHPVYQEWVEEPGEQTGSTDVVWPDPVAPVVGTPLDDAAPIDEVPAERPTYQELIETPHDPIPIVDEVNEEVAAVDEALDDILADVAMAAGVVDDREPEFEPELEPDAGDLAAPAETGDTPEFPGENAFELPAFVGDNPYQGALDDPAVGAVAGDPGTLDGGLPTIDGGPDELIPEEVGFAAGAADAGLAGTPDAAAAGGAAGFFARRRARRRMAGTDPGATIQYPEVPDVAEEVPDGWESQGVAEPPDEALFAPPESVDQGAVESEVPDADTPASMPPHDPSTTLDETTTYDAFGVEIPAQPYYEDPDAPAEQVYEDPVQPASPDAGAAGQVPPAPIEENLNPSVYQELASSEQDAVTGEHYLSESGGPTAGELPTPELPPFDHKDKVDAPVEIDEGIYTGTGTLEHKDLAALMAREDTHETELQAISAHMEGVGSGVVGFEDVEDLGHGDAYVEPPPSDLGMRVLTGVTLLALLLGAMWAGGEAMAVFIGAIMLLGLVEFYTTLRKVGYRPLTIVGVLGGLGLLVGTWFIGLGSIPGAVIGVTVLTFFLYAFMPSRRDALTNGGLTVLGVAWVTGLSAFALPIVAAPDFRILVLGLAAATVAMDVGAYFTGKALGSRQLAPVLSPNKSVEGLAGGVILCLGVAIGFGVLFDPFTIRTGAALGLVVAIAAPLGDLAESLIKRSLGVKDMGAVLPGHGGILDRVDAFLFVLPPVWVLYDVLGLLA